MKYKLTSEEKSQVMLTVGLVILHYRHNCLDGNEESSWRVGMINSEGENVRQEIIDKCWNSNSFIFDNNSIGFWNVYSKKIAGEVLKKVYKKGFTMDTTFKNLAHTDLPSYIYIFRK